MNAKILSSILVLVVTNFGLSQTTYNTEKKDSTNVYHNALKIYCETIDKTSLKDNTIYVEYNFLITEKLPNSLDGMTIKYLREKELIKIINQNNGEITLVRIVPLRIRSDNFFVNIIPFKTTYSKKRFYYANSGGLKVIYIFDSKLNGLIFKESKWGWI